MKQIEYSSENSETSNTLACVTPIPAMTDRQIQQVRDLEREIKARPQTDIATQHIIHAGVYARTVIIPAGVVITGVLIRKATLLILQGDAVAYLGDRAVEISGYHILAASANRKQAFYAKTNTCLTMLFATDAKTVREAEDEFSSEPELLMSRQEGLQNYVTITGE